MKFRPITKRGAPQNRPGELFRGEPKRIDHCGLRVQHCGLGLRGSLLHTNLAGLRAAAVDAALLCADDRSPISVFLPLIAAPNTLPQCSDSEWMFGFRVDLAESPSGCHVTKKALILSNIPTFMFVQNRRMFAHTMDEANLGGSTDYEQANERQADWSESERSTMNAVYC